jgi:hypothetical protein
MLFTRNSGILPEGEICFTIGSFPGKYCEAVGLNSTILTKFKVEIKNFEQRFA